MKAVLIDRDTFMERYPEQKPVCLNYAIVREDMLALIEETEALRFLLASHIRQDKAAQASICNQRILKGL